MRPFGALISYQEAGEIIDRHIHPLTRTESIPIDDAVNRVLAEDLSAAMTCRLSTARQWMVMPSRPKIPLARDNLNPLPEK